MQKYWIRKCKLEFYNQNGELLYEYYGGSGKRDGKYFEPKVYFDIVKTTNQNLQTATIKMYNLNKEDNFYKALLAERLNVRVFAGYAKDFENGTDNMIPIYFGTIYPRPKTIYSNAVAETILYCYYGASIKKSKMPAFSIKGAVTTKILLSYLRDKINQSQMQIQIPEDNVLQQQLGSQILNKKIAQLGYSTPPTRTIDDFMTMLCKLLTDDDNEIRWYLDDAKKQIVFYNMSASGTTNNEITLTQGINILEFDNDSVLRTERSDYLANLTGQQMKKKKRKIQNDRQLYRVATFLCPNIYLDTKVTLKNIEAPEHMSIYSIRYFGDTHGQGHDWRIDLDLYERGARK